MIVVCVCATMVHIFNCRPTQKESEGRPIAKLKNWIRGVACFPVVGGLAWTLFNGTWTQRVEVYIMSGQSIKRVWLRRFRIAKEKQCTHSKRRLLRTAEWNTSWYALCNNHAINKDVAQAIQTSANIVIITVLSRFGTVKKQAASCTFKYVAYFSSVLFCRSYVSWNKN